jgi:uncharacterized protein
VKLFVLLILVLLGVWFFRNRQFGGHMDKSSAAPPLPQEMLRCRRCDVHLPAGEAVIGAQGVYCCQDHLQQSEH